MLKAYKYRLYPTKAQQVLINKHLGACRWLYNYGLGKKIEAYARDKTHISRFDLQAELPLLKKTEEYSWLGEINSLSLQAVLRNLDSGFKNFFRESSGFPRFKSKKSNRQSFQIVQNTRVDFTSGRISIPKIPNIQAKLHRQWNDVENSEIKTCTISKTPSGKYYISILVDTKEITPDKLPISENQAPGSINDSWESFRVEAIAFDLGIKSFLIASNKDVIDNPRFLKKSLTKLKRVCRQHSRKQKGSNNRSKHRIKLSRVHEKVTNQRNNFLHQKTAYYIKTDFITFCFEDLNVKGMVRNHKLAQSINDVGWSTFRKYLTYKADWTGKNILTIGRFEPSSKLCSNCGTLHRSLTLRDRIFKCQNPKCNLKIDRDYQASLNIKRFAFHHQNMVNDKLEKIGKELAKSIGRVKVKN
jgi:putative transposase